MTPDEVPLGWLRGSATDPVAYVEEVMGSIGPATSAHTMTLVVKALSHELGQGEAMRITRRVVAWALDGLGL